MWLIVDARFKVVTPHPRHGTEVRTRTAGFGALVYLEEIRIYKGDGLAVHPTYRITFTMG